ncbi:DNA ligase (ATP) [Ceratobasidium sp. 395]|nr:DNA ligase (ATP) [Ceratobasidium sp. 395]
MSDSVDLLVVAGTWGSGRRGGKVSALICAVRDDYSRAGVSATGMNVIGTGLTIDDYDWINKKKWIRMDKKAPPAHMKVSASNKREDKGDVYLSPEDWFIVSVKEEFGTNLTMRFPRCKAIRRDLSVDDCLTWSDLRELHGGKRQSDQDGQPGAKKRKTGIRKSADSPKKTTLALSYQAAKVKNVETVSDLFEDMRFLVIPHLTSTNPVTKAVIETLIYENGGDFTQVMQGDNSLTVIYGGTKIIPQVRQIMKREDTDILKPQWLTDSIAEGRVVPLQAKYYFYATQDATNDPAYHMDDYEANEAQRRFISKPNEPIIISSSPEPEEQPRYLKRESSHVNVAHIPDDPSASETESDPDDSAGDLSDGHWTEIAVTTASGPANAAGASGNRNKEPDQPPLAAPAPAPAPPPTDVQPSTVISAFRSDVSSANSKLDQNLYFRQLMDRVRRDILVHGGSIATGLSDSRLTHVVLHERDKSRRVELIRRIAKPQRRHMVLTAFISACVTENTLLDEDAFMP